MSNLHQYQGITAEQAAYGDPDKWGYEPADPFGDLSCGPNCEGWCDGVNDCAKVKAQQ